MYKFVELLTRSMFLLTSDYWLSPSIVVDDSAENYRTAMVILQKGDDFRNAKIAIYQSHADKFFQQA